MEEEHDIMVLRRKLADTEALLERSQEHLVSIFQKVGRGNRCPRCKDPIYFMPHLNLPRREGNKTEIGIYNPDGSRHLATCRRLALLRAFGAAK